jgi:maintenance of morphology protein 1
VNRMEQQIVYKSSSSSFAYGLIIGQLSILIVFAIFIRFFIFADAVSHHRKEYSSSDQRSTKVLSGAALESVNTILEKTYYNVATHQAESLDWFTVLIAQAISQFRQDAHTNDNMLRSLNAILNGDKIPDFVDRIRVTELNVGGDYPIFSNCKILYRSGDSSDIGDGLEAQIDVDLTDTITLGIETRLLLNFPKALFAVLPVSLSVSIIRFSGTLTVSLKSRPDEESQDGKTHLTFSFAPDYRLEFNVKSLVGARSRLQDVPKIGQFVEARLRQWFTDRCVSPRYQQIPLPSFFPRSKTTKEKAGTSSVSGLSSREESVLRHRSSRESATVMS